MKKLIALAIVIGALALAYTGAWFWAAGEAGRYVRTLATADGVTSPRVTCGTFAVSGFPFGFDVTCNDAALFIGDTTVTLKGLKAAAEVYRPTHVILFAQSPAGIEDAFTGTRRRLDFASAEASARLEGWRIGRISLVVEAPVWNDTVLEDRLVAKATRLEAHLIDIPEQHDAGAGLASLAGFAQVEGLDAPGLDIAQGRTTLEGEVSNLPDDVRTYGDADLLGRWQAAGGRVRLVSLRGDDATSAFEATGTLGLDGGGRIEGQVKLSSRGVVERLDATIPEQFRGLVLGAPAEDGSYSQTINIAAGVVFAGLVPTGLFIPPVYVP